MKLIPKVKTLLGFCARKGCRNRTAATVSMGREKFGLCEEDLFELIEKAVNVTAVFGEKGEESWR